MICTLNLSCYLRVDEGHICYYFILLKMMHKNKQKLSKSFPRNNRFQVTELSSNKNVNKKVLNIKSFSINASSGEKKLQLLCDLLNIWTKEITDCFSQYNERKSLIIQNHNGDSWRTTSATVNCTSTYLNKMVESHVINERITYWESTKIQKTYMEWRSTLFFSFLSSFFFTF